MHKACTQWRITKGESKLSKARETKNSPTDGEEVRPQALDQSNKVVKNNSMTLATGCIISLTICKFYSLIIRVMMYMVDVKL